MIQVTNHSGNQKPLLSRNLLRKRQIATLAWTYLLLIGISTFILGTFSTAFMASLKVNPLESPYRWIFPQISPTAWLKSADLGQQGANDRWWGGFSPDHSIDFFLVYEAPAESGVVPPTIDVPRRKPGGGKAAAITKIFASDYAEIHARSGDVLRYAKTLPNGTKVEFVSQRFDYRISYVSQSSDDPWIERVPLISTAPRTQSLVDSSLPVTRMERRGRTASWDNISPGFLGLMFNNYRRVVNESVELSTGDKLIGHWMRNSFLIGIGRVVLTIVLASLAGYALARFRFFGSRVFFTVMLFSMTIPIQVTFISNYLVIRDINLLNSPWAVIMVVVVSAHVLIMKQFFEGFPKEIEEAAIVDGASRFGTFWRVVLPNAVPALMTNTIMAFQGAWNDFFWPLVLLTNPERNLAMSTGLLSLRVSYGGGQGDWGLVLAGAFISIVPIFIMFFLFQRYITDNQVNDGIK